MDQQQVSPLGSVWLSALPAAMPPLDLVFLLGGLKVRAWLASLIGLGLALTVPVIAYQMPVDQAGLAALAGAAFGVFFPAMWVVVNATSVRRL